jgi:hypothetical protein
MSENFQENDYGIYVIFTRDTVNENDVLQKLISASSSENDVLYCRGCYKGNDEVNNRYICCIKKSLFTHLTENCNFQRGEEYNIARYRVNNEPLTNGMTYGFFIRCQDGDEDQIREIFSRFESSGYIKGGSYKINTPTPYPNGSPRGYIIVSFEKNGDRYPRLYIRKLKALLNNSSVNGRRIHVNWVSNSVLRDVLSSENKEKKMKTT